MKKDCKICKLETPTTKLFLNRELINCCESCYMSSTNSNIKEVI